MEKLQDLSQSELQELLDNPERVESMALESDEVKKQTNYASLSTWLPFLKGCIFWLSERLSSQMKGFCDKSGNCFKSLEPLGVCKIKDTKPPKAPINVNGKSLI